MTTKEDVRSILSALLDRHPLSIEGTVFPLSPESLGSGHLDDSVTLVPVLRLGARVTRLVLPQSHGLQFVGLRLGDEWVQGHGCAYGASLRDGLSLPCPDVPIGMEVRVRLCNVSAGTEYFTGAFLVLRP